ncbi:MAG: PAS domain-containing protein [Rhizobacter sp.]|nr:PAS domain-containing protein [Rhizobacter sp.]
MQQSRADADRASELASLRIQLDEAEQTLRAIRSGEIDAIVVDHAVYTLDSANAASNRLRSDVLAQMKDAVVAVDLGGRVIYLNAAAESQYGVSASHALGHPLERLYRVRWYSDGDRARSDAEIRDAGSWRGESVHVRNDDSELHVESTLATLRDGGGGATGRLIVSRDVSERYHAAAALRSAMRELARSEREFSTLVENSPFIFARFDRRLRYTYVSPLIEKYTGRPCAAFVGRRHAETGVPVELADTWDALLRGAFETGKLAETSFSFTRSSGEVRHFEARLIPEVAVEGGVGSVLAVASDVSEREVADRERRAANEALREADRRKDVFIATLAHELRNPLAPIANAVEIMRLTADEKTQVAAREMIDRQLRQLVHLVDDLLDVSRISQGKLELRRERVELKAVLRNAVETSRPLIDAGRHELVIEPGPVPGLLVDGDMTRLTQVVANLLNNAAKYTPSGGRITVATVREGDDAVIRVSDTGIGIPADRLPEVFEMFAQVERSLGRAQGGLGIGLALVRRLVEMHGGSVLAASAGPGQGSRFEVRLPVVGAFAGVRRGEPAPEAAASAGDGSHILIADDNRDSADSMAMMLELLGYRTTVVYDGDEALQSAATLRPPIAILDIGMPRINGNEVAQRLRAEPWGERMVLIALSGWGRDDDRRKTAASGFDHHLVKPLDLNELATLLAPLRGGPSTAS